MARRKYFSGDTPILVAAASVLPRRTPRVTILARAASRCGKRSTEDAPVRAEYEKYGNEGGEPMAKPLLVGS
jgi:hypothetical protein